MPIRITAARTNKKKVLFKIREAFFLPGAPGDRKKRGSSHGEQICKGGYDRYDRKYQSDACQCLSVGSRKVTDIDPVHYIIKQLDQLRDRKGNCLHQNMTADISLRKIIFHIYPGFLT